MRFRHTVQQFEDEVYLLISHNLKENGYSIAHLPVASDSRLWFQKENSRGENSSTNILLVVIVVVPLHYS